MGEDMTITYGSVSIGGSTARRIDGWTKDETDYTNAWFEFEFVTTAASGGSLVTELDALRAEFRKPRLDLVVIQNGATYLSRKHSDNTGLNTFPRITKDGDPADTGRSHHFRVRIEYELPADNVSTNFRRGSTINVQYTPSRRRTVTISGIYTANSSDGSTTALAQYSAQIAAYATSALSTVDASATWDQIGEPQVEYFETNKLLSFTRVYREVIFDESDTLNDADIVDPQMVITRSKLAPGDSRGGGIGIGSAGAPAAGDVQRPTFVHIEYATNIKFPNTNLEGKWESTIRDWIITNAKSFEGHPKVILTNEEVRFDDYENRIMATMDFIAYESDIFTQRITHRDLTAYGRMLIPVAESDPFKFYDFQGPIVRQRVVTEEREEKTTETDIRRYVDKLVAEPGSTTSFGEDWALMTREPMAAILKKGLTDGAGNPVSIAEVKIETVLQYRKKKPPSTADVGGIKAGTPTPSIRN